MDELDEFYTDQSCVDWYKTTEDKRHSQHFSKRTGFWIWFTFENASSHKYVVQKAKSLWMLDQKWLVFISCSYPKITNLVLKISDANIRRLIIPQNHPWHAGVWRLKISIVCGVRIQLFWIKFQSTSENVYETFNFSLKRLGPTQMAYWAKKYVTVLTRTARWMPF